MSYIKIYENIEFGKIRVEEIGQDPWFIAKDVCTALDLTNITETLKRLDEDELSSTEVIDSIGRKQRMYIVNESGLYNLILQSRKIEAKKFKKWITSEVIPSIRKNGGYIANQENLSDDELMAKALLVAQNKINEKNKVIEEMKPNYLIGKAISGSNQSITIGNFANILLQNGRKDLGQNKLFEWFRNNGYLSNRKGCDWNRPTYKATNQNLFEVKETYIEHNNGFQTISFTPLITPKGQKYFINKFIYGGIEYENYR